MSGSSTPGKGKEPESKPAPHPEEPDPSYGVEQPGWTGPSPPDSQRPQRAS